MPSVRRIQQMAPYLLMVALGAIEPLTHCWIQYFPPDGAVPTGMHTGDSGHHLAAIESFGNGFYSPFVTCEAGDGGLGLKYFAVPIFLLYGVAGEIGRMIGLPPFLWLGLINGAGGMLLLWSVYRFLRRVSPTEAQTAFYLYALGGGLGGITFLLAWLGGGLNAPGFEGWFYRFAQYELIEGQHLSPILLMPRFYYTLPMAIGFAALTALVETDWCRCPGHLFFTCFLLLVVSSINARLGPLFWGLGSAYLLLGSRNDRAYRVYLGLATAVPVVIGSAIFVAVLRMHPSYAGNVSSVTQQCVLLLPLIFATLFHWPAVLSALHRMSDALPRSLRALVFGLAGYLVLYALLYFGHQAWYGNWWQGGDIQAALRASDWALLAAIPAAAFGWYGQPKPGPSTPTSPALAWLGLSFLVLLVVSLSTWGNGFMLRFAPQRCMVLLGVPLAVLAAGGLQSWRPQARKLGFGLIVGCGVVSQAVAALYFQGPLGRTPGQGPFAHLHYEWMTEADAQLLKQLPPGTIAVPPWSPIAFGEIVARQGDHQVLGGPGALNLGDQPFQVIQGDVNHFFDSNATDNERREFAERWCMDYVYCPDTCPVDSEVLQSLREAEWLSLVAEAGQGTIFRVQKNAR